jgi:hypothetical protein
MAVVLVLVLVLGLKKLTSVLSGSVDQWPVVGGALIHAPAEGIGTVLHYCTPPKHLRQSSHQGGQLAALRFPKELRRPGERRLMVMMRRGNSGRWSGRSLPNGATNTNFPPPAAVEPLPQPGSMPASQSSSTASSSSQQNLPFSCKS